MSDAYEIQHVGEIALVDQPRYSQTMACPNGTRAYSVGFGIDDVADWNVESLRIHSTSATVGLAIAAGTTLPEENVGVTVKCAT